MDVSRVPDPVLSILEVLRRAGFSACLVGGCVRDILLGRVPDDWDVATSALPDEVSALFDHALPVGQRYGTVKVLFQSFAVEVTTFRCDGPYHAARRPESVTFVGDIRDDLSRRDFTIGAMAWTPDEGLIDPFGGLEDLDRRIIRCVGDPSTRFSEDALRMLRAYRFAACLGFALDGETERAIRRCASLCRLLSVERVREEWQKMMLCRGYGPMRRALEAGLIDAFVVPDAPARAPAFAQLDTIFRSAPAVWRGVELRLPLLWAGVAALLCDRGGITSARTFLSAWKLPGKTKKWASDGAELALSLSLLSPPDRAIPLSDAEWRRACYAMSVPAALCAAGALDVLREACEAVPELLRVLSEAPCLSTADLALKGHDILTLGFSGPRVGQVLRMLMEHVLEHPEDNTREDLLALLKRSKFGVSDDDGRDIFSQTSSV